MFYCSKKFTQERPEDQGITIYNFANSAFCSFTFKLKACYDLHFLVSIYFKTFLITQSSNIISNL